MKVELVYRSFCLEVIFRLIKVIFFICFGSVSYTHLDVYKRQVIGWRRDDFPENRKEQGGWLIGRYILDPSGIPVQGEVTDVLEAKTECRFPGYIEWDATVSYTHLDVYKRQAKWLELCLMTMMQKLAACLIFWLA